MPASQYSTTLRIYCHYMCWPTISSYHLSFNMDLSHPIQVCLTDYSSVILLRNYKNKDLIFAYFHIFLYTNSYIFVCLVYNNIEELVYKSLGSSGYFILNLVLFFSCHLIISIVGGKFIPSARNSTSL